MILGGDVIFLVIIIIAVALPLGYHKWMGVRAMTAVAIEVPGLTTEQITDIGTKASESMVRRLRGRAKLYPQPDGSVTWYAQSGGGVMTFNVEALPDGSGHRIIAAATSVKVAQHRGVMDLSTDYGKAKLITNWILWKLGIPANARVLLRRRRKALHAIERAGVRAQSVPQSPAPNPGMA
jgi:hypothetical protein